MKHLATLLLFALAARSHAQFTYHHAFAMGNTTYDAGQDIAVDDNGNVYVTGSFTAWFDADPGAGTTILQSAGDNDVFLAKFNDAGVLQWAFSAGGSGFDAAYGVEVSGNQLYLVGATASSDGDFDPGAGTLTFANLGAGDIFVVRYDLNGTLVSGFTVGGSGDESAVDIEVEANGDFAICGNYDGADFDADPAIDVSALPAAAGDDAFLIKYDAFNMLLFGHGFGGGGNLDSDRALGMHRTASGDLYVTGSFSSTGGDFDPGPGTTTLSSAGSIDLFLSKFNAAGTFQWAKRIGDTGGDLGYAIATDSNGDVYLSGYANSASVDLDPGPDVETFSSGAGQDIILVKLTPAGDYIRGLRIGGGSSDIGFTVLVDDQDHLFLAGEFGDIDVDMDPGAGTALLSSTSAFETDLFLAQFDTAFTFVDAFDVGGIGGDAVWAGALTATGRLWVTGKAEGPADADPGSGTALLDALGGSDIFVGAYDHLHPMGIEEVVAATLTLQPNPARDHVTVDLPTQGSALLELTDARGRVLLTQQVPSFPVELDLRNVPAGIYTLTVNDGAARQGRKLLRLP